MRHTRVSVTILDRLMGLSAEAKVVYYALLFGPHRTSAPGLLRGGPAALAEASETTPEAFSAHVEALEARGLVVADLARRVLFLPDAVKDDRPANPNTVRSWTKVLDEMPACEATVRAWRALHEAAAAACALAEKRTRDEGKQWSGEQWAEILGPEPRTVSETLGSSSADSQANGSGNGSGNSSVNGLSRARPTPTPTPSPTPTPTPSPTPTPTPSPSPSPGADAPARGPAPEDLLRVWNENRGGMLRAKDLSGTRLKHAKSRLREEPDLERWTAATQRAARSKFCLGGGERGWKANFDWVLRPGTLAKIEEGQVDDETPGAGSLSRSGRRSFTLVGKSSLPSPPERPKRDPFGPGVPPEVRAAAEKRRAHQAYDAALMVDLEARPPKPEPLRPAKWYGPDSRDDERVRLLEWEEGNDEAFNLNRSRGAG